MGRTSSAAVLRTAIPPDDPAWIAAMNAPFDDTPDTEQEKSDLAEARAVGHLASSAEVRQELAQRRPR